MVETGRKKPSEVVFLGLDFCKKISALSILKEAVGVYSHYELDSIEGNNQKLDRVKCDLVVFNLIFVQDDIKSKIGRIRERFPEANLLCLADLGINEYDGVSLMRCGVEIIFS